MPGGTIRFTIETLLDQDSAACFTQVEGEILQYAFDTDEFMPAGRMEFNIIDVQTAQEQGWELFDLFDETDAAHECYSLLYDPGTDELREPFLDRYGEAAFLNLLLFERLEILPAFRGAQLGLLAMERAMQLFGQGCGYALLKAMPLQFESHDTPDRRAWFTDMGLHALSNDESLARSKLQAYYARLGFRALAAGSPWMALNLEDGRSSLVHG